MAPILNCRETIPVALNLKSEVPLEASEARLLVRWVRFATPNYPELRTFYRIPNEAIRTPQLGAQLKRTGSKKGMPDYCLPVPRNGYGALYLELKRRDGGTVSEAQQAMQTALIDVGNKVEIVSGWEHAKQVILSYLQEPPDE